MKINIGIWRLHSWLYIYNKHSLKLTKRLYLYCWIREDVVNRADDYSNALFLDYPYIPPLFLDYPYISSLS